MDEVYYEEAFCNTKERIKYLKEIQKQIGVGRKKLTGREDEVLSLTIEGHRLVDISAKLNTGKNSQLYFELRLNGKIINPKSKVEIL